MKRRDWLKMFLIGAVILALLCVVLAVCTAEFWGEGAPTLPLWGAGISGASAAIVGILWVILNAIELPGEMFETYFGDHFQNAREQGAFDRAFKKEFSKEEKKQFKNIEKKYKKKTGRSLMKDIENRLQIEGANDCQDLKAFIEVYVKYPNNAEDAYKEVVNSLNDLEKQDKKFVVDYLTKAYTCFTAHCRSEAGIEGIGISLLIGQRMMKGDPSDANGFYKGFLAGYQNPTPVEKCYHCGSPLHQKHVCHKCGRNNIHQAQAIFLKDVLPILEKVYAIINQDSLTEVKQIQNSLDKLKNELEQAETGIKNRVAELEKALNKKLDGIIKLGTNEHRKTRSLFVRMFVIGYIVFLVVFLALILAPIFVLNNAQDIDINAGITAHTNWFTVLSKDIEAKRILEPVLPEELEERASQKVVYKITSEEELTQEIVFTLSLDAIFKDQKMNVRVYQIDGDQPVPCEIDVIDGSSAVSFTGKPGVYAVVLVPYVVSYYDGDELLVKEELYHGDKLSAPAIPAQIGYDNVGFADADGKVLTDKQTATGDSTYYVSRTPKNYEVTLDANGGTVENSSLSVTFDQGYTLPTPVRPGYAFDFWVIDGSQDAFESTGGWKHDQNLTLQAVWTARTDTKYVVKHYQQNATGDGYTLFETENLTGTTDTEVTPAAKDYPGFKAPTLQTEKIAGDGALTIELFYKRITYTITLDNSGGSGASSHSVCYGGAYSLERPQRGGYDFLYYVDENNCPIRLEGIWEYAENKVLIAVWSPRHDTEYIVEHYKQDAGGGDQYTLFETEKFIGVTDQEVMPATKKYTGFKAPEMEIKTVTGNSTCIIRYYYTRNQYCVIYHSEGGNGVPTSKPILYGNEYRLAQPTRPGYIFTGYEDVNGRPFEMQGIWRYAHDVELYATWNPCTDIPYKVLHYKQNASGTGFELAEMDELIGVTDSIVTPETNTYDGYAAPALKNGRVLHDGSLMIEYYYYLQFNIDYVLDSDDNSYSNRVAINDENNPVTYIADGQDVVIAAPKRGEYDYFLGWYEDENYTIPFVNDLKTTFRNVKLFAKWDVAMYYDTIDQTPADIRDAKRVVINWSDSSAGDAYVLSDPINIYYGVDEIFFIGNSDTTYRNVRICTVDYPKDSELVVHIQNMHITAPSDALTVIDCKTDSVSKDVGMILTIDCIGHNSIVAISSNGSAIANRKKLILTGSGELTVQGGHGSGGSWNSATGKNGGAAIIADTFIVNMEGTITIQGGDGGTGYTGGNGGMGGSGIVANEITILNAELCTIIGGRGGFGGHGADGNDAIGTKFYQDIYIYRGDQNVTNANAGFEYCGIDGTDGKAGGSGGTGGIAVEAKSFVTSQNCAVVLIAGNGGNGGAGGQGGDGSDGADGNGAAKNRADVQHGGRGGNGGIGGRGGDGGFASAVITCDYETSNVTIVEGVRGNGGDGGAGGNAGNGGSGGTKSINTLVGWGNQSGTANGGHKGRGGEGGAGGIGTINGTNGKRGENGISGEGGHFYDKVLGKEYENHGYDGDTW